MNLVPLFVGVVTKTFSLIFVISPVVKNILEINICSSLNFSSTLVYVRKSFLMAGRRQQDWNSSGPRLQFSSQGSCTRVSSTTERPYILKQLQQLGTPKLILLRTNAVTRDLVAVLLLSSEYYQISITNTHISIIKESLSLGGNSSLKHLSFITIN